MSVEFAGALFASVYGCCTVFRKKTPLFYRIVFFAMLACLMGNVYTLLYEFLWRPEVSDFHVGYMGYIGMFFFLHSSYYGAFNSLADGKQLELRVYRLVSGVTAIAFFIGSVLLMLAFGVSYGVCVTAIPMSLTVYFAVKLLIIPDVDMGIIKVMRLYNAIIVGLCFSMILSICAAEGTALDTISGICTGLLLALCMPAAKSGVRKWFI